MPITLIINQSFCNIHTQEIPTPHQKTVELFKKTLGEKNVPSGLTSLKGRIEKLEMIQEKLHAAKSSAVKDKIVAFLATAFLVGLFVASIVVFAAGPPGLNMGIGGMLLSLYVILTEVYNQNFKNDPGATQAIPNNMNPCSFLKVLAAGPFIPVHQAFTKVPNLLQEVLVKSDEAEKEITEIHNFYKSNQLTLERELSGLPDEQTALQELKESSAYFAKFFVNRPESLANFLKRPPAHPEEQNGTGF